MNSSFLNVMKIKMASTPCTHYRRKCQVKVSIPKLCSRFFSSIETFIKFQFSCCGGIFGCVQCHNEVQSHRAKRKDLEAVICSDCKHQQDDMTNICSQCDTKFGEVRNFILSFTTYVFRSVVRMGQ